MKKIYSLLFCAAALFGVVSCESNDGYTGGDGDGPGASNIYVLNCGGWGYNNASLTSYDLETSSVTDDIFSLKNSKGLGDLAQDMLVFGDKIFISVYNSGVIFVTDLKGTVITEITDDTYFYPRYLTSDDEYVYVSYYDGGVAKIDPTTNTIVAKSAVATNIGNPEQLVEYDGKLYITISDFGYGNAKSTVDVYSTSSLAYVSSLEVIMNPTLIESDGAGNLYVISMGNYGYGSPAVYATLQKINIQSTTVKTIDVTDIEDATPSCISMGGDGNLYIVEGVSNASTGWAMVGNVYTYNPTTGVVDTFITDGTSVPSIYSITTNHSTGELYVGSADGSNTGDMYVFNADGTLKSSFGVGVYPMEALAITIEE